VCEEWVEDFKRRLSAECDNARMRGVFLLAGIRGQKVVYFNIPYGATGNTSSENHWTKHIVPEIIDLLNSPAIGHSVYVRNSSCKNQWFKQQHTMYEITFQSGAVWYIDLGFVQWVLAGANVNSFPPPDQAHFFTPKNKIPTDWPEFKKVLSGYHDPDE
jgi:hypothetical protein